jgi:hypothetical protein
MFSSPSICASRPGRYTTCEYKQLIMPTCCAQSAYVRACAERGHAYLQRIVHKFRLGSASAHVLAPEFVTAPDHIAVSALQEPELVARRITVLLRPSLRHASRTSFEAKLLSVIVTQM